MAGGDEDDDATVFGKPVKRPASTAGKKPKRREVCEDDHAAELVLSACGPSAAGDECAAAPEEHEMKTDDEIGRVGVRADAAELSFNGQVFGIAAAGFLAGVLFAAGSALLVL